MITTSDYVPILKDHERCYCEFFVSTGKRCRRVPSVVELKNLASARLDVPWFLCAFHYNPPKVSDDHNI